MNTRRLLPALAGLLACFIASARATTNYVDASIGQDYADGLSPTVADGHGPKLDTYSAIAAAQNGDTIIVAAGTYSEPSWDAGTNDLTIVVVDEVTVLPLTDEQLAAINSNPWAHGLTCLQVFQNPSVLIADGYSSLSDGLPDWWKVTHNFGLNDPAVANADSDGDGVSNVVEYQHGTDAFDPNSIPWLGTMYYANAAIGSDYADGLAPTIGNGHGPKKEVYGAIAAAQNDDHITVAAGTAEEPKWNPRAKHLALIMDGNVNVIPLTDAELAGADTNAWAHGLTRQQVFDNPNVLIADGYSSLGDGIADWWKVKHGFGLNDSTVARSDPDHDGYTNFQEYHVETDPNDPGSTPTNVPPYLVGWWKLDEGHGSNALDSAANNLTGQLVGNPLPTWTSGINSNALLFDGTQNYLTVTDSPLLTPTNALTVAAWFQAGQGFVITKWTTNSLVGSYGITITNLQVAFTVSIGGTPVTVTHGLPMDSSWHHVVGVYDGTQVAVYLDGATDGTVEATGKVDVVSAPLMIGLLGGAIDDVRLYSRALDANEIAAIRNQSTVGDGIPDWWKVQHGLSVDDPSIAAADTDGDGYTTLQEYKFGGDPLTPWDHPWNIPPNLLAWWAFNEGQGSNALDSAGNNLTATLSGDPLPAWTSGISSNALVFDGTNSVSVANVPLLSPTNAITLTTWIKTDQTATGPLISKWTTNALTGSYSLAVTNGKAAFSLSLGGTPVSLTGTSTVTDASWHQVAGVYDGAQMVVYVDGVADGTLAASGPVDVVDAPVVIGHLAATLDEVRLYGRGIGSDEVAALYNCSTVGDGIPDWWKVKHSLSICDPTVAGADPDHDGYSNLQEFNLGTDPQDAGSSPTNVPPHLVGWWKLNEGQGETALDSAHNNLDAGFWGWPEPIWTNGIASSALQFDGVQNGAGANWASILAQTNAITLMAWVAGAASSLPPPPLNGTVADSGVYSLGFTNGHASFTLSMGGVPVTVTGASMVTDTSWHHIAGVFDGTNMVVYRDGVADGVLAAPGTIDGFPSWVAIGQLAATLSDVRIYSRAVAQAEIAVLHDHSTLGDGIADSWKADHKFGVNDPAVASADPDGDGYSNLQEYRLGSDPLDPLSVPVQVPGRLVGWWKLDEGQGTSAQDSSGNSLSGTLSGSPLPSWTSGINSNALSFDGTQNLVSVPNTTILTPTNALTVAAWIQAAQSVTGAAISKWAGGSVGSYSLGATNGQFTFTVSLGGVPVTVTGATPVADALWHHVAGVYDGTNLVVYLDGAADGTLAATGAVDAVSAPLVIGQVAATLDDVRLYSRALGPDELYDYSTLADGIPDWWKTDHGFSLNDPTVAMADSDLDGYSNLQEYNLGTDPQDADSTPTNVPPNLIGWWKLDEGQGSTTLDSAGDSLTGTMSGSPLPAWVGGISSNALLFDGAQTLLRVPNSAALTPPSAFTLMAWVAPTASTSAPPAGVVVEKWAADYSAGSYSLGLTDGQVAFSVSLGGVPFTVTSSFGIWDTNWHHVAGVYDGTQMVAYLDGVADGSLAVSGSVDRVTAPLLIGGLAAAVDDVRLYGQALSTNEIAAVYNYSTLNDGIPDWWKVKYGFSLTDSGVAAADPDQDNIINLYEYQYGTDPLVADYFWVELNAGLPATTNDFVSIDATSYPYPVLDVSLDSGMSNATVYANSGTFTFNLPSAGSTNYPVYFQFATTAAPASTNTLGQVFEQDVVVDKDPPILTLIPGQGQTNDLSNPLLVVQYSDALSGVDISSLVIKIDDVDVTASFYVFAAGAVADGTALAAGAHTWSAGIVDLAGNVAVTNATFVSTGAANPNAPTLSNLNLTDSITVMPDVPEIWVQGQVSGAGSAVYASVNGGEVVQMNRRDDDFGRLLPLDYGTNVIVLTGSDAVGANLRSKVLLVERSDRFKAAITSPAFGTFANGQQQTICGIVSSKYDDDTASGLGLAGLAINEVAIAMNSLTDNGDGTKTFCATVPGTNCSVMALVMQICWTNVNGQYVFPGIGVVTNNCPHIPLGLLEGYEIVSREEHTWGQIAPQVPGQSGVLLKSINPAPPESPCPGMWSPLWVYENLYVSPWGRMDYHSQFTSPCSTSGSNSVWNETFERPQTNCVSGFGETNISWEAWPPQYITWPTNGMDRVAQPERGLGFGSSSEAQQQLEDWSNPPDYAEDDIFAFTSWRHGDGTMTVRWPLYYDAGHKVLLTFEGVGHSGEATNVLYLGQAPLVVTNGAFSYLATVSDDHKFTLDASSFAWNSSSTNYVWCDWHDAGGFWMKNTVQTDENYLTFTGFHNNKWQWNVRRNFQSRADAVADVAGLTIEKLAKEIHLEASQFTNWLQCTDADLPPATTSEQISLNRKFTIPNVALITQGYCDGPYVWDWIKARKDMLKNNAYKAKEKYKIVEHFLTVPEGYSKQDVIDDVGGTEDLYLWAHFGHGVKGQTGNLFFYNGLNWDTASPANFHVSYNLSEVVLYACAAGDKDTEWLNLLAKGGTLWSTKELIWPHQLAWTPSCGWYRNPYWQVHPKIKP